MYSPFALSCLFIVLFLLTIRYEQKPIAYKISAAFWLAPHVLYLLFFVVILSLIADAPSHQYQFNVLSITYAHIFYFVFTPFALRNYIKRLIAQDEEKQKLAEQVKQTELPSAPLPDKEYNDIIKELLPIPDGIRFEHTFIVGPSGVGKTQLIQYLISRDLDRPCSVVVIDSSNDLINNLATLKHTQHKTILIEADNFALNPFSLKGEQAVDLLTYMFSALSDSFTSKQDTLYRYCIRLLQEIPGATVVTFLQLLQPRGIEPHRKYLPALTEPGRIFFLSQFDDPKAYAETKTEVARRLMYLLENPSFEKMFSAPTRFDLFEELNTPKLILVNTDKDLLGENRSSVFGRLFLSLLLLATRQRSRLPLSERFPVFCYIDEMQEYQDDKITQLLNQARKANLGLILATQRTKNISNENTLDALLSVPTIYANTSSDTDNHKLSRAMGMDSMPQIPRGHFYTHVRNLLNWAIIQKVPFGLVEAMEHVSIEPLRRKMKERYGTGELPPTPPAAPQKAKEPETADWPPAHMPKPRGPSKPSTDDDEEVRPTNKL